MTELRALVGRLPDIEPFRSGPLDRRRLGSVTASFLAGDDSASALIRSLVMIAVWYDVCGVR